MTPFLNTLEKQNGLNFTKISVVQYIEDMLAREKIGDAEKAWEQKLKSANINFYLKKGNESPFLRTESIFDKKWKMNKIVAAIYNPAFKK